MVDAQANSVKVEVFRLEAAFMSHEKANWPGESQENDTPGHTSVQNIDGNGLDEPRPNIHGDDVETGREDAGDGTNPEFLVGWDEPEDKDPANPLNWKPLRKWGIIAVLSSITFLTPLASSMFAPGVPQVMSDFDNDSSILATFVVSIFVLGFAIGPLLLAPLSEMIGRTVVYHVCNVGFIGFSVACALATNMDMLVAFRFFAGFVGVAAITCGSGTIADMIPQKERGRAMAAWSMGPLLGPILGPVAGGFLVQAKGWRWSFWVIAICAAAVTVAAFLVLRESYAPVLLARKARELRKKKGNPLYRSKLDNGEPQKQLWARSLVRPAKMLLLSPIVSLMSVYVAVMYGVLYILFTTFTFVYQDQYGFSASSAGLSFLGAGIGTLLGLFFVGAVSDRVVKKAIATRGSAMPEDRLPWIVIVPAGLCLPVGLFIYGWGVDRRVHWIVPMIGNAVTGFGMMGELMCIQTYLVDAFTIHAASAIAANAVLRSLLGALLPLCGLKVYHALGFGWGNSLLGFVAFALTQVPVFFKLYGQRIRQNPRWQVKL
ncbi:uncharacterized protein A1O5_09931 [Cladophialophora psammophila CBS 110553]|uniref:Major facilitator superfamily (MFS) profile domain-containing protein n=1 Tax=Cladophialophora psammophila CBS 110553 TaxID=1182543 RepID=W9WPY8_9EURO|nr:uncharacterized protein A1O5_09931 [Cladophialophora psammophila CBS 110553]EXJ66736.1 hypothetical protein A1O5_09931 [Cladophialophora psammophila CBS 110553]